LKNMDTRTDQGPTLYDKLAQVSQELGTKESANLDMREQACKLAAKALIELPGVMKRSWESGAWPEWATPSATKFTLQIHAYANVNSGTSVCVRYAPERVSYGAKLSEVAVPFNITRKEALKYAEAAVKKALAEQGYTATFSLRLIWYNLLFVDSDHAYLSVKSTKKAT